jgi:hypothetical protein
MVREMGSEDSSSRMSRLSYHIFHLYLFCIVYFCRDWFGHCGNPGMQIFKAKVEDPVQQLVEDLDT